MKHFNDFSLIGILLMTLYGRQRGWKSFFFHKEKAAVLFCTDIAAHAPCCTLGGTTKLSWRYQYLVGRSMGVGETARYEENGKALLFLLPSERNQFSFQKFLWTKRIFITQVISKKVVLVQRSSIPSQNLQLRWSLTYITSAPNSKVCQLTWSWKSWFMRPKSKARHV